MLCYVKKGVASLTDLYILKKCILFVSISDLACEYIVLSCHMLHKLTACLYIIIKYDLIYNNMN